MIESIYIYIYVKWKIIEIISATFSLAKTFVMSLLTSYKLLTKKKKLANYKA